MEQTFLVSSKLRLLISLLSGDALDRDDFSRPFLVIIPVSAANVESVLRNNFACRRCTDQRLIHHRLADIKIVFIAEESCYASDQRAF